MGFLIANGETIASSRYEADIWYEDDKIPRIDQNIEPPADAEVVDAGSKYVFPGLVDPHTHIHLPFYTFTHPDSASPRTSRRWSRRTRSDSP